MATKVYPTVSTSVLPTLPVALPKVHVPSSVDIAQVSTGCVKHLSALREEHLTTDAVWRDTFALTGSLRTHYGASEVMRLWREVAAYRRPGTFRVVRESCRHVTCGPESSWLEARFNFETERGPATTCSGFLSLVFDRASQTWKIWVLRTILEQLKGCGHVDKPFQELSVANGTDNSSNNTSECCQNEHFDCVVVGGGQSGLSVAGRLASLGLKYVVLEKNARIGDNWAKRYDATKLHTTRHYSHLPFERTFTDEYSMYPTKSDLARGYAAWAAKFDIKVWLSTALKSGKWDDGTSSWRLYLHLPSGPRQICAKHIVYAVGAGGQIPTMPIYPGLRRFEGTVLHSAQFSCAANWTGMRGVVVGTANTAHDIAEDMLKHGMHVTMVQRSRTSVLPVEYLTAANAKIYHEDFDIELADRLQFSNPIAISRLISQRHFHALAAAEPERFDALERAGFKVERYGDMQHHLNEKLGGHYVDVGASAKIAAGQIKMKSDALPRGYTRKGLTFTDGTELEADLIVFATGFLGNMRQTVADSLGEDVADVVEDFWGLNAEGEILGAYKPSGHPKLWMIGGGCGHSRYYSRFVALQVKADVMGSPLKVFDR